MDMESPFPHGSQFTRRFRYYLSRIACNLRFLITPEFRHGYRLRSRSTRRLRYYLSRIARSLRHHAPRITLRFPDRSLLGGCATISMESLVTLGITPLELRQHQSHNPKHDDPSWGISYQSHWTFH